MDRKNTAGSINPPNSSSKTANTAAHKQTQKHAQKHARQPSAAHNTREKREKREKSVERTPALLRWISIAAAVGIVFGAGISLAKSFSDSPEKAALKSKKNLVLSAHQVDDGSAVDSLSRVRDNSQKLTEVQRQLAAGTSKKNENGEELVNTAENEANNKAAASLEPAFPAPLPSWTPTASATATTTAASTAAATAAAVPVATPIKAGQVPAAPVAKPKVVAQATTSAVTTSANASASGTTATVSSSAAIAAAAALRKVTTQAVQQNAPVTGPQAGQPVGQPVGQQVASTNPTSSKTVADVFKELDGTESEKSKKDLAVKAASIPALPKNLSATTTKSLQESASKAIALKGRINVDKQQNERALDDKAIKKAADKDGKGSKDQKDSKDSKDSKKVASADSKVSNRFAVQLASLPDGNSAQSLKKKVGKACGKSAVIQTVDVSDKGTMHRVRIGPFDARDDAKACKDSLASDVQSKAIVMGW